MANRGVAVGCKVFDEAVLGDSPGLLEAGHTFADFRVGVSVVVEWFEVVHVGNFLWDSVVPQIFMYLNHSMGVP